MMFADSTRDVTFRNYLHPDDLTSYIISCYEKKIHTDVLIYSHDETCNDKEPIEAHSIVLANAFINFTELCYGIKEQGKLSYQVL